MNSEYADVGRVSTAVADQRVVSIRRGG
jgi:hypothetical protein